MLLHGCSVNIRTIGNVMTSVREAQALASLKYIHPSLQQIILQRSEVNLNPNAEQSSIDVNIDLPTQMLDKMKEQYNSSQLRAISAAVSKAKNSQPDVLLLQGPPGKLDIIILTNKILLFNYRDWENCNNSRNCVGFACLRAFATAEGQRWTDYLYLEAKREIIT